MRMLRKNNWKKLYIGLYHDEEVIYKRDDDGNIVTTMIDGDEVPVKEGTRPSGYEILPKPIYVNLATNGSGEAEAVEYGLDISAYEAKFSLIGKSSPIEENSLFWESEPTVDSFGFADGKTASWKVVKISENINGNTYLLKTNTK